MTKPDLNHVFYFIVGAFKGKESSHIKGSKGVGEIWCEHQLEGVNCQDFSGGSVTH